MKNAKTNSIVVPPNKMAAALSVAARIQIQSIRLVETSAKQSLAKDRLPTTMNMMVQASSEVDTKRHTLFVRVKFGLLGRYEESDTGEAPLHIKAEFLIVYNLTTAEGLTQENYEAFAELNGVHNGWPYWREYVQSVSARMGFPPIAIPVYRVLSSGSQASEPKAVEKARKPPAKGKRRSSAK
jgi:hypothetical protein